MNVRDRYNVLVDVRGRVEALRFGTKIDDWRIEFTRDPSRPGGRTIEFVGYGNGHLERAFAALAKRIGQLLDGWRPPMCPEEVWTWAAPENRFYALILARENTYLEEEANGTARTTTVRFVETGALAVLEELLAEAQSCLMADPGDLISVADAAEESGTSERTILRRIADGTLPAYRDGRHVSRSELSGLGSQVRKRTPRRASTSSKDRRS